MSSLRLRPPGLLSSVILLALIWLALCAPWLTGERSIPFDSKDQFYPALYFASQSLRQGELPFWNPFLYGGYPAISDPQSMLFSPLALALMTIVDRPSIHWFDAVELLHVLMGGLGILLLAVQWRLSPLAGLFAAVVYMFGGPAAARLQHTPIILAYGYFPFALLTLDRALASNRRRWGLACGVAAGIMAAHQNQAAYLFSLLLVGYVVDRAAASESFTGYVAMRFRVLATAAVAGAAILAVPLLATLQLLPLSNRAAIPYAEAVQNTLHPLSLLTAAVRDFFNHSSLEGFWGFGDITESFLYIGILPLTLALRYGIGAGALLERRWRYFAIAGGVALLYAFGRYTPLYWIAYYVAPGVSLYQRPPDALFVVNFVLAVASGLLLERLLAGWPGSARPRFLLPTLAAAAALAAWGIRVAWVQGKLAAMGTDIFLAVGFAVLALALWRGMAAARAYPARLGLALLALLLLTVDLRVHNVNTAFNAADPAAYSLLQEGAAEADPAVRFLTGALRTEDHAIPYRVEITGADSLWANAPMVFGLQQTQGYNPFRYRLYQRAAGAQAIFNVPRPFTAAVPGYDSPLFDLLGVRYIVSGQRIGDIDPAAAPERFPLVHDDLWDGAWLQVWENPRALPRILTATRVLLEPDPDAAIDAGRIADIDYSTTVVLSRTPEGMTAVDAADGGADGVADSGIRTQLVSYRYSGIAVDTQAGRDFVLVVTDLYYPYWRVYVDGDESELLRANYLFRGVHVPAGSHRVLFRFEPLSWPAVLATGIATIRATLSGAGLLDVVWSDGRRS